MNRKKVLSAAILLILTKSALGKIEVEPNNISSIATTLELGGVENVGQLSQGSDIDFFSITNSCLKYPDDLLKTGSKSEYLHKKDECVKYGVDGKPFTPAQEATEITKGVITPNYYYPDMSLSFACNSRALASNNSTKGWYLTIHDAAGNLQSSYQVIPDECATGTASSKGPYNFKLPTSASSNTEEKYYLSVVGDCRRPIFNIDTTKEPLITINTADKPSTSSDIDKATKAFSDVKTALDNAKAVKTDFDTHLNDIPLTAIAAIDTAQLNITAAGNSQKMPNLNSVILLLSVSNINIDSYIATATDITENSVLNMTSKAQVNAVKSTAPTVNTMLNAVSASMGNIGTLTKVITAAEKITPSSALKTDVDNLIAEINSYNNRLDAINSINTDIENLNTTAENLNTTVTTTQDICTASNTANYTIKDNPDTAVAPYKSIKENAIVLGKENYGQNGSVADVDFFELAGTKTDVIPLNFSCAKNSAKGKDQGWVLSAWKPNDSDALDKPEFVYQVSPADCNAPEVYSIQLPSSIKNYYIGVQSACALPPRDTSTTLQSSGFYSSSTSLDYLCDANTANFTLTRDFKTATLLVLDDEKTGKMNSRSDYDLFVVEDNATEDYSVNFSCESSAVSNSTEKPSWKISAYDDSDKLVNFYPKLIKGSECKSGLKLDNLPRNATRYYLAVEPASSTATVVDTSKYKIKKSLNPKPVETPTTGTSTTTETAVTLGETKLLSTTEKGQITKKIDKNGLASFSTFNYYVDGSSKKETELIFSCSAPKILFSNNWKVSIYKSDKTLKEAYIINSSDCIPDKLTGESSYIMTIPQESARFYMQVKSMCEDSSCTFDDSEFTITRKSDISPVMTNTETTPTKTAFTPYSNVATVEILDKNLYKNCIKTASDIHFYSVASSLENDVPVEFSCLKSTETTGWTISIWEHDSVDMNKAGWLYQQYPILSKDCSTAAKQFTVPSSSNTHYISIQSSCLTAPETNESELTVNKTCKVNTASYSIKRAAESSSTPIVTAPTVITQPVIIDPIVTALLSAKNIGVSQANKLKSITDIQAYYVDTGIKLGADFEFICSNSTRFKNDWTLLIYNAEKVLKDKKVINGSDCGMGLLGDNGALQFTSIKDSTRTYLVVKSACETADKTCELDKSQYEIKRILPAKAPTTGTATSTTTAPCFHTTCDASTTASFPVFGAN
ncbi:MAG: hypothetical protein PHN45_02355 [Methylococcales bacterium]|nr:hypothetical protein [Methylococcales bacterium]